VLSVFAPILAAAGILGFVLPDHLSLMSGAAAYNVFHLGFAALGGALALRGSERAVRAFNAGFGAIDLYQLVASALHLFPEEHFRWRAADDVLHLVIGVGLVAVGTCAGGRAEAD